MKRIVIELTEDDFEALLTIKNLLNISWRDFIIAGAVWWVDNLDLEQKIESIYKKVSELKTKN